MVKQNGGPSWPLMFRCFEAPSSFWTSIVRSNWGHNVCMARFHRNFRAHFCSLGSHHRAFPKFASTEMLQGHSFHMTICFQKFTRSFTGPQAFCSLHFLLSELDLNLFLKNRTPSDILFICSKPWYFSEASWMEPSLSTVHIHQFATQPGLIALILCVSLRLNSVAGVNQAAFESLNRWKCGFYECLKMGLQFLLSGLQSTQSTQLICSQLVVKNKTLLQWQARLGLPIALPEIGTFNERALYTWAVLSNQWWNHNESSVRQEHEAWKGLLTHVYH